MERTKVLVYVFNKTLWVDATIHAGDFYIKGVKPRSAKYGTVTIHQIRNLNEDGAIITDQFRKSDLETIKEAVYNKECGIVDEPLKNVGKVKAYIKEGIEIDHEHKPIYMELKKRLEKEGIKMPMSEYEFYEWIAWEHIKENGNYYELLLK